MVLSSTPVADLIYRPELEMLFISWTCKPDLHSFKKVYNQAFEFVSKHRNIRLFCIDQTNCGAFGREHEAWLTSDFNNRVYQLLEEEIFVAVVFTERHFNAIVNNYQVYSDSLMNTFIHFNYFTSSQEAQLWLQTIKKGQDMILS